MRKLALGLLCAAITPAVFAAPTNVGYLIGFDTADTYNVQGFDRDGLHRDTGTSVDPEGYGPAGNQAPVINSFSVSPASGAAPLAVTFSHDITDDVGVPSINIDYGDGSSGTSLTYTYTTAGNWTATLTATDAKGLSATGTTTVNVTGAAPTCYFDVQLYGTNRYFKKYRNTSTGLYEQSHVYRLEPPTLVADQLMNQDLDSITVNSVEYTKGTFQGSIADTAPYVWDYYEVCY